MAQQYDHISPALQEFIEAQKLFFVGTAMSEGRVNVSPKGMDTLRVLDANRVLWLNLTGSGNETAAHLMHSNRITIMFCAFEGKPLILRLYGSAKVYHERDAEFHELSKLFPAMPGSRQLVEVQVELVQTSCGYGVPLMDFVSERETLRTWAESRSPERIRDYWASKNTVSLDGHPTNIFGPEADS